MKIDGLRHPKTKELAHALGVDLPHAIGLLELMWAFAAQQTPQGNIGKWSNAVIADESGWTGCPDLFVNSLILVNFLDESESHRLLVHDWAEHAPNWLRAKLKKLKKTFLSADLSSDLSSIAARTIEPTTSLVKASLAKAVENPCAPKRAPSINRALHFDDFWQAYPEKRNKKKAREIWQRKKLDDQAGRLIEDVKTRIAKDRQWIDGFIPHATTYLNGERWEDEMKLDRPSAPADGSKKQWNAVLMASSKSASDRKEFVRQHPDLRNAINAAGGLANIGRLNEYQLRTAQQKFEEVWSLQPNPEQQSLAEGHSQ